MFVYRATIFKDTSRVIGIDVEQNALDLADFETNHKDDLVSIADYSWSVSVFYIDVSYTTLKAKIDEEQEEWDEDVKYRDNENSYELVFACECVEGQVIPFETIEVKWAKDADFNKGTHDSTVGVDDSIQLSGSPPTNANACWHLNEGEGVDAEDATGNGNKGTLWGNGVLPIWTPGKLNSSLNFYNSSYVSVDNSPYVNLTDSISIELWVNVHTDGSYKAFVCKHPFESYYLGTGNAGEKAISFYYGGLEFKFQNAFVLDTWHHVVVTYDRPSTKVAMYVDGIELGNDPMFNPIVTGGEGVLGLAIQPYTDWDYVLDGLLDEVIIYDRALTPEEVAIRYNAGAGIEWGAYYTLEGKYTSCIYDSLSIDFEWNQILYHHLTPANTAITYKIRTSNDSMTWGEWSSPMASGEKILPKGRYIQWQAELTTSDNQVTPLIYDVDITFLKNPTTIVSP